MAGRGESGGDGGPARTVPVINMRKDRARLPNVTFSGVKRKRIAGTSVANVENSFEKWSCALCHVNLYSEFSLKQHYAGPLHRSNVAYMEWTKQTTGLKRTVTAESYSHLQLQRNPAKLNCSICQVSCSGEADLKNHLKGRRHQENAEALRRESRELERNRWLQEAKLCESKPPQLLDKSQRYAPRWNCSICKATDTSESGLESHLRGQRHQQNVKSPILLRGLHNCWPHILLGRNFCRCSAQCIKLK